MPVAGLERKTNPVLVDLIVELRKASQQSKAPIWEDVAERLERPARLWPQVNVEKVAAISDGADVVLVPGKVLSTGEPKKGLKVAAFAFSENARQKIEAAGGKCLSISEALKLVPGGKGVRIIQ
jgi:large subunit ribosomal protein L18e